MVKQLKNSTSYTAHALIAFLIGLWLVSFLILIAPFDTAELSLKNRMLLMPAYGLISFTGYMMLVPIQNYILRIYGRWTWLLETGFLIAFNVIVLLGSFIYYKSEIMNGLYSFNKFTLEVYYPIFVLLLAAIIFLRFFLFSRVQQKEQQKLLLTGDYKTDTLQIDATELVSVNSADNYVEIHYFENGEMRKKVLRKTLKSMALENPQLIRVHRSYLINPIHFLKWKNKQTIVVSNLEIPVTSTYKKALNDYLSRP